LLLLRILEGPLYPRSTDDARHEPGGSSK
jgi:hypothetical protein